MNIYDSIMSSYSAQAVLGLPPNHTDNTMGDSGESESDNDLVVKPSPTYELLKKCTSAWQQLSAKRKMAHELKQYQEVFLTELPGSTKVTGAATHAVLEGELEDDEQESGAEIQRQEQRTFR